MRPFPSIAAPKPRGPNWAAMAVKVSVGTLLAGRRRRRPRRAPDRLSPGDRLQLRIHPIREHGALELLAKGF